MGFRELLVSAYGRIKSGLKSDISEINTSSIIVGALVAIVISASFGPVITGAVAHTANDWNVPPYQSPPLSVSMTGGSGYTIEGESLEEFGGVRYDETVRVYEIVISNPGKQPIQDLDINVPLPGCVVDYNTGGVGSEMDVLDFVSLDLRGQSEGLDVYSCSKTITVEQLDPGDTVSVRFLLQVSFDECDLLQGVGTENLIEYNYQWRKNGIQFFESGDIGMGFNQDFRETFGPIDNTAIRGKPAQPREVVYTNYLLANATTIPQGMGKCRLMSG
ncbi:hypothetical protein ACFQJC_17345 [Haloferax namakaokahaiae]|uniref:DUF11 domain-containing protein n=1 Tax=Haloferax namakaokahaiae TaxID=1748331 RepID=A0ABD5ZJ44_9EURY